MSGTQKPTLRKVAQGLATLKSFVQSEQRKGRLGTSAEQDRKYKDLQNTIHRAEKNINFALEDKTSGTKWKTFQKSFKQKVLKPFYRAAEDNIEYTDTIIIKAFHLLSTSTRQRDPYTVLCRIAFDGRLPLLISPPIPSPTSTSTTPFGSPSESETGSKLHPNLFDNESDSGPTLDKQEYENTGQLLRDIAEIILDAYERVQEISWGKKSDKSIVTQATDVVCKMVILTESCGRTMSWRSDLLEEHLIVLVSINEAAKNFLPDIVADLEMLTKLEPFKRDCLEKNISYVDSVADVLSETLQKLEDQKLQIIKDTELPLDEIESEDKLLTEYGIDRKELDAKVLKKILDERYPLVTYDSPPAAEYILKGYGGFSEVYEVILLGKKSAVKVMKTQRSREPWEPYLRVLREVKAWWELKHDNILPLEGYCINPLETDVPAMVAPWCKNGNLRDYLSKNKITLNDRLNLVLEVAKGLQFLHDRQPHYIIHGDMKPENILIDDDLHARLCDLGIAKVMDENSGLTTGIHYTARYRSPELEREVKPSLRPSKCSDIWALGCIFSETVIGEVPYSNLTNNEITLALRKGESPDKHFSDKVDIDDDYLIFLKNCWEFYPDQRSSASETVANLQGLIQALPEANADA